VDLVEVDVVGAESAQARLAGFDDVVPGLAQIVGAFPMGPLSLVAMSAFERRFPSASPRISSDRPAEQTSAVSKKLTPRSRHMSIIRAAPSAWTFPMLA